MFSQPLAASVPGGDHLDEQKNCHDFNIKGQVTYQGLTFTYGFALDGMGSGEHSEVGAKLGGRKLESLIVNGLKCPEHQVIHEGNFQAFPQFLYLNMLNWMQGLIDLQQPVDLEEFLRDYLMFSVVGFIIAPVITLIMRSDDGLVQLNSEVKTFTSKAPNYMGHHLVPESSKFKRRNLPQSFIVDAYFTSTIQKVLVATDGMIGIVPSEIWSVPSDGALHRKLIGLQRQGKLSDDGSIVMTRRHDAI